MACPWIRVHASKLGYLRAAVLLGIRCRMQGRETVIRVHHGLHASPCIIGATEGFGGG